jgi:predicted Zn-dependent peptidase
MTLAVSGDFDADQTRAAVAEAFGDWTGGQGPDLTAFPDVETMAPRQVLEIQADKLQGWVVIGHELPPVPS